MRLVQCALLQATVLFECKAQAEGGHLGAFLKDARCNYLGIICMKCGVERCAHCIHVGDAAQLSLAACLVASLSFTLPPLQDE